MYKYSQGSSPQNPESVVRIADGRVIQFNESDLLYKAVKLWMSRGNEPAPPDVEHAPPSPEEAPVEEEAEDTPSEAENASEDVVQPTDESKPQSRRTRPWRDLLDKK